MAALPINKMNCLMNSYVDSGVDDDDDAFVSSSHGLLGYLLSRYSYLSVLSPVSLLNNGLTPAYIVPTQHVVENRCNQCHQFRLLHVTTFFYLFCY